MNKFCVSLTSIPPRFPVLEKTLNSIKNQNKKPDKIFLNIPKSFQRFEKVNYNFDHLLKKYDNLIIKYCTDYGPGTKLLGSLNNVIKYDYVILLDDDHIYRKEMLEIFYQEAQKNLNNSYSFCIYDVYDCNVGQGADGFMINTDYLNYKFLNFFDKHVKRNKKLLFNDDLWISIYLNKILKVDIVSVFSLLKQPIFFKYKSIYKKHTQLGALIETYSSNRRKARNLRFQESCNSYLELKNKTNNFLIV